MQQRLLAMLEEARELGFLGPGPVDAHLEHAGRLLPFLRELAEERGELRALDLGSGGGVPGLVLATALEASWTLLEVRERRAGFLRRAVLELGLGEQVVVLRARAEEAGRDPALRAGHDLVTARSFGPPAVTAECGAPLLRLGGALAVSEPPQRPTEQRWPEEGLAQLGLRRGQDRVRSWIILEQASPCPQRYPRRAGTPARRPLW